MIFLFVPDTFWDRTPTPSKRSIAETEAAQNVKSYHPPSQRPNAFALQNSRQQPSSQDIHSLSSSIADYTSQGVTEKPVAITESTQPPVEYEKNSYWKDVRIYQGRFTKDSWWMVALRPFVLYTYPHVLFGSFIYSLAVVWLIVISETIAEIFRNPLWLQSANCWSFLYIAICRWDYWIFILWIGF